MKREILQRPGWVNYTLINEQYIVVDKIIAESASYNYLLEEGKFQDWMKRIAKAASNVKNKGEDALLNLQTKAQVAANQVSQRFPQTSNKIKNLLSWAGKNSKWAPVILMGIGALAGVTDASAMEFSIEHLQTLLDDPNSEASKEILNAYYADVDQAYSDVITGNGDVDSILDKQIADNKANISNIQQAASNTDQLTELEAKMEELRDAASYITSPRGEKVAAEKLKEMEQSLEVLQNNRLNFYNLKDEIQPILKDFERLKSKIEGAR